MVLSISLVSSSLTTRGDSSMDHALLSRLVVAVCLTLLGYSQPSGPATPQLSAETTGNVIEIDAALKELLPASAKIEKLAGGFGFVEGPIWMKEEYILFSDIPNNAIMKWTPDGKVSTFRKPSGYNGPPAPPGAYVG